MARMLKSKQAIARDQGVSRQTVHAWMSDSRWTLGTRLPIDGEQIDAWRAKTFPTSPPSLTSSAPPTLPSDGSYSATRQRVDLQLRAEQTMLLRQKRGILENKFIERELHDRALVGLVAEFRGRIEGWIEALPPLFAHQSEVQIRKLLADAYDRLCEEMMNMPELFLAEEQEVQQLKDHNKSRAAYHKHHAGGHP